MGVGRFGTWVDAGLFLVFASGAPAVATSGLHGGARKRFGGSARLLLTPIFVVYLALKTVSVNLFIF